jgi:hypothetical protein
LRSGTLFCGLLLFCCWILNQNQVFGFLEENYTASIARQATWMLKLMKMNVLTTGITITSK